ncbi:MAG: TIGR02680 family protein [Polyangiaceae bacterium]|nr:TIGR02680 family protein [Polyangiaceae bacterium]
MTLPSPVRARWQPLRSGLVNLYRYDREELHFEEGRLLLRGNNGSGKSRILALQLPFLLDGEVHPHRIEPDADPAKRIEWNLLMSRHEERRGYTWIEFGRRDDDGAEHYVTLGCGLHAAAGRGLVQKWFFVTRRRIGRDVFLESGGAAISRERLEAELGGEGEVLTSAAAYRAAVDKALFGLGSRYDALVDLLIQLRQPQLSRSLDEAKLGAALSTALPPVPPQVVGDVAESFRSLEAYRIELEGFRAARDASSAFLAEYRRYAEVAARRRAECVRRAHGAYETAMRGLRGAEVSLEEARAAQAAAEAAVAAGEREARGAAQELETLRQRPEMDQARALDEARRAVEGRGREAADAERERGAADAERDRLARRRALAAADAGDARAAAAHAVAGVEGAAREVGLAGAIAVVGWEAAPDAELENARRRLDRAVAERARAAAHLRKLAAEVERAERARARAEAALEGAGAQLDRVRERERDAAAARAAEAEALVTAWLGWAPRCTALRISDVEDVASALEEWCESGAGESPAAAAIQSALRDALAEHAARAAEAERAAGEARAALRKLEGERDRLRSGAHSPPPAPPSRSPGAREGRPGAPLWQLTDFAPGLDARARAGIEAALEASGLLDAWVTPDGRVLAEGVHDAALSATIPCASPRDERLDRFLVPAPADGSDVPEEIVAAVLARIGGARGAGPVWVDPSGHYALGPLHGAWDKAEPAHVGHASREAARRRRLAEIEIEIEGVRGALDAAEQARIRAEAGARAAQQEARGAPQDAPVRRAIAALDAATGGVADARAAFAAEEQRALERRRDETMAIEARDRVAADLGLSAWVGDLDRHDERLGALRQAAAALWPTARAAARAAARAEEAADEAEAAAERARAREQAAADAALRLHEAEVHQRTLARTHGAAVEEILRLVEEARRRALACQGAQRRALEESKRAFAAAEVAGAAIAPARDKLDRATRDREVQIAALAALAAAGLLDVIEIADDPAAPGATWTPTRAIELARRIEAALSGIDHDDRAWDRLQKGIFRHVEALRDALLQHRYEPQISTADALVVVTVRWQDRDWSIRELEAMLGDEVGHRQSMLDAREREVLENHLIGEVASHLHDLLHRCEDMVRDMNRELDARPTSTGMKLRFAWTPREDGPAGLLEARQRLMRAGGTWSPADRELLARYLKDQIEAVRARTEAGSWQEHLTAALDYRAWHAFAVERFQDGVWRRLTRRTHGTGSGGEKALALTIPQFAAAAAHYRSADPRAPRLILLDEAFVGIDTDMRAKCMGLLAAFDLDFVMTSEREWGCYATLPAVAIHHLVTRPGIDAVGVTRWVWNGKERVRADVVPSPAERPDPGGASLHLFRGLDGAD